MAMESLLQPQQRTSDIILQMGKQAQMDRMTWSKLPPHQVAHALGMWEGGASEASGASHKHLPFDIGLSLSLSHMCWWGVGSTFHGNRQIVHNSKRKFLTCPTHAPSP